MHACTLRRVAPVHVAAECGRAEVLEQLVSWIPSQLEAADARANKPIHHAACRGQVEAVVSLARLGAALDPANAYGATPLHLAAQSIERSAETCALLLGLGASPKALDALKRTPADYAAHIAERGMLANGAEGVPPAEGDDNDSDVEELDQQDALMEERTDNGAEASGNMVVEGVEPAAGSARRRLLKMRSSARRVRDMLLMSAQGVPLQWSFGVHTLFPADFRMSAAQLLFAMSASPIGKLPAGVRDDIFARVIGPLARTMVWGMMDDKAFRVCHLALQQAEAAREARMKLAPAPQPAGSMRAAAGAA